ncbi:SDR family oxidoreductase [Antrihabitans stalactiti]|uniref:SDR family oxidoreductase n=1 Tax=Antrihabitans stalactiti TaxID=2584121 RepID=A0A848KKJ4_9NOCA|nr:SDR family oxidoreductase [Antrihabitans stalactiti]NMN98376.1 SDR family oxidoreductase [Antrihabitans stalactiti]
MSATLEDKVVIVTGSGGGIGAVIAARFAKEGARVIVSDRDRGAAEAVASRISGAIAIPADVTSEQDVSALIERTLEAHSALHHVVANAGVIRASHPIAETPLDVWRSTMSVNLDGVFLTIKHSAAAIANSGGGSILTLSSISGTGGTPLAAAYGASKAAVRNLTATAAGELRAQNVRVNALVPGYVNTPLIDSEVPVWESTMGLAPGGFAQIIDQKQGRLISPEDIADAALFLTSDQASMITGSSLTVDGGFTSQLF